MKKIRLVSIILAILTLTAFFTSCGDSEVPDGMKSVTPDGTSFVLYVPKAWVDNSACGTASAVYSSSDKSNVSVTCITMDDSFTTVEEYLVYADACLAESLPEYELIAPSVSSSAVDSSAVDSSALDSSALDTETVASSATVLDVATSAKFAGVNALSFEYRCRVSGVNYRFRQVVCLRASLFYVFTYTAEEELFDSHTEEVDTILSEITFR